MKSILTDIEKPAAPCRTLDDVQIDLPPCQAACPVGTDIPSYASLIWDGNLQAAIAVITATNPLSSICGRVCASPCEAGCKRGENDGAVTIRHLKRFVMEQLGDDYSLPPVAVTRKETIGIVGSGPTGLTAAQDLAEAGFAVHIYEQSDRLGGMMNAIPKFRLPAHLLQQDIQRLLDHCPGIQMHLNTALGNEISMDTLKQRHDAILVSIGLCRDRSLAIPGEDTHVNGIYGIDLLERISRGETLTLDGPVVVVGGGNVAMDMARTARRCGSPPVELYCLESRDKMPAWEHEIAQAEAEGVTIHAGWGPQEIVSEENAVTTVILKRCTAVFDASGDFNPTFSRETRTQTAGSVLLAIGLEATNPELEANGMLARGRMAGVDARGRSSDPQVFAAGDCSTGPTAIVYAMNQGHQVAHSIQAFLDGIENPPEYKPAYYMRNMPVAQASTWEKLPREEPQFVGLGTDACSFEECEAAFDTDVARTQAARCLRCDAETGTANYSRRARNLIQSMARTETHDGESQAAVFNTLLEPRNNPFPAGRPAHIDDVVFLSAALTRLVIDPYREACSTATRITRTRDVGVVKANSPAVNLAQPFFCTGFDEAPAPIREALARGLAAAGCGYIGRNPLVTDAIELESPLIWYQLVTDDAALNPAAHALIHVLGDSFRPITTVRCHPNQLIGLSVATPALPQAVPYALENKLDLLLLDGAGGIETPWRELHGQPDLRVIRDALRLLREMNREEEIALINFGGMRSGTDVAKALALNCNASVFSVAMALAMGGSINGDQLVFTEPHDAPMTVAQRQTALNNWIRGTAQEVAIIARCTGKTDIHNLEPEDMRSITLSTARALDLPLAAGQAKREWF